MWEWSDMSTSLSIYLHFPQNSTISFNIICWPSCIPSNTNKTRKNCFRYLKLMSPLNTAICTTTYLKRQKCYGPHKKILFKKQLFYLEVKGHYGMQHTDLWSCTHIRNIIDLSRKRKMLWPVQENTI